MTASMRVSSLCSIRSTSTAIMSKDSAERGPIRPSGTRSFCALTDRFITESLSRVPVRLRRFTNLLLIALGTAPASIMILQLGIPARVPSSAMERRVVLVPLNLEPAIEPKSLPLTSCFLLSVLGAGEEVEIWRLGSPDEELKLGKGFPEGMLRGVFSIGYRKMC